jgi:hypothetical protein
MTSVATVRPGLDDADEATVGAWVLGLTPERTARIEITTRIGKRKVDDLT